jgi:preprotein translocase subunit SecY
VSPGRRKISQYTRYLTVVLAIVQATGMTVGMANQGMSYNTGVVFFVIAITSLVTGAVFMMWLGEQITEKGVGNGISLLIFAGIVAGLPAAIGQSWSRPGRARSTSSFCCRSSRLRSP